MGHDDPRNASWVPRGSYVFGCLEVRASFDMQPSVDEKLSVIGDRPLSSSWPVELRPWLVYVDVKAERLVLHYKPLSVSRMADGVCGVGDGPA